MQEITIKAKTMKTCTNCGNNKELTEFFTNKTQCKVCIKLKRQKRLNNKSNMIYNITEKICKNPDCILKNQLQPIANFQKDVAYADGYRAKCNACNNKIKQKSDHKNKEKNRARKSIQINLKRKENKQRNNELKKSLCCAICSAKFSPEAMDWDHIDPSTKYRNGKETLGVAKLILQGYTWEVISAEIEKCRLLCAICHKKETFKNLSNPNFKCIDNDKHFATIWKKSSPCAICNNYYGWWANELDHIDHSSKIDTLANMVSHSKYSFEDVVNELDKCQNLCVCCHRTKSLEEKKIYHEPINNRINDKKEYLKSINIDVESILQKTSKVNS